MLGQYWGPFAPTDPIDARRLVEMRANQRVRRSGRPGCSMWHGNCGRGRCTDSSKVAFIARPRPRAGAPGRRSRSSASRPSRACPSLSRSFLNPSSTRRSSRRCTSSPRARGEGLSRPTQIWPCMNVPVVRTTAGAKNVMPKNVSTPWTSRADDERRDHALVGSTRLILQPSAIVADYSHLSVCARSAHTAGPRLAFRTRFWR